MVNIYNEHTLQEIYYQIWVYAGGRWTLQDRSGRLRFKPTIRNPTYKTKIVEIVEESRVVEEIEPKD